MYSGIHLLNENNHIQIIEKNNWLNILNIFVLIVIFHTSLHLLIEESSASIRSRFWSTLTRGLLITGTTSGMFSLSVYDGLTGGGAEGKTPPPRPPVWGPTVCNWGGGGAIGHCIQGQYWRMQQQAQISRIRMMQAHTMEPAPSP